MDISPFFGVCRGLFSPRLFTPDELSAILETLVNLQRYTESMQAQGGSLEDLPEIVARCHEAGAKAYLTLNIIVYDEELEAVHALCGSARKAGVAVSYTHLLTLGADNVNQGAAGTSIIDQGDGKLVINDSATVNLDIDAIVNLSLIHI